MAYLLMCLLVFALALRAAPRVPLSVSLLSETLKLEETKQTNKYVSPHLCISAAEIEPLNSSSQVHNLKIQAYENCIKTLSTKP